MVSRHGLTDCIVLVELFVGVHEVDNRRLEVVKHADPHCIEEVSQREVAHNTRNTSKNVESSVYMARREFAIPCLGVGIAKHSV